MLLLCVSVVYIIHYSLLLYVCTCLCRNGVVRYESVMMLRNKLDELWKMEGITEKEKGMY